MNAPAKSAGFRVIGPRPVRPDGAEKVTGRALYGPDFSAPGMLHGAILRSPHAHARIRAIDASKALALPAAECAAIGARARAAVLLGYTTEAMQAATIAVYRELIG